MIRSCSTDNHPHGFGNSGFTLIELMVAIALISLVLSGVYGIFGSISATQKRLESESEGYHQARVIFDRIGRELRTSYLDQANEASAFSGGRDSNDEPFLAFTSTSALIGGNSAGGLVRVRYELETELGDTVGRLWRSAVPLFVPDDDQPRQRLSSTVKHLEWRFFDGTTWQEQWDSRNSRDLPQAVEMSIVLLCDQHEIRLVSAFDLSMPRIER